MSAQSDIASRLARWVRLVSLVVQNNPDGSVHDILAREDVASVLVRDLDAARELALADLLRAWPTGPSAYRARLQQDINRAYAEAGEQLRDAVIAAFDSVPSAVFVPGVTVPGRNPAAEAAALRARAVTTGVAAAAWRLGFRNEMTVNVAGTRRLGEGALAEAGPGWEKKWACKKNPDGSPDSGVCFWCRRLDAMPAIPVGQEFSYGEPDGNRRPPRVYLDLLCPPRHPRCRCRIILVRAGVSEPSPVGFTAPPARFVQAADIRSMPEGRYQAMLSVHRSAAQALGQAMREAARNG